MLMSDPHPSACNSASDIIIIDIQIVHVVHKKEAKKKKKHIKVSNKSTHKCSVRASTSLCVKSFVDMHNKPSHIVGY